MFGSGVASKSVGPRGSVGEHSRSAVARNGRSTLSKAVVLAGGDSVSLQPLTNILPKSLLPVLYQPLIDWQLRALAHSGVEEVCIALAPDNAEPVSRYLEAGSRFGVELHLGVDDVPRGPAGSIKRFEEVLEGEAFLVVDGSTFLGDDLRIDALIAAHRDRGAVVTLGVLPRVEAPLSASAVVSPDGVIDGIIQLHQSSDRRRSRSLAGLAIFDSSILRLVPEDGYFDIKEGLFRRLQERKALAIAETTQGLCVPIDSVPRYYELLTDLMNDFWDPGRGYRQLADGVWIGRGTVLPESAYLLGPVLIGSDCRIEDGVQLIGPVLIGDRSRLGSRCVVRSSILWEGSKLAAGSKVEASIVAGGAPISEGTPLKRSVVVPAKAEAVATGQFLPQEPSPIPDAPAQRRSWYTARGKRVMDVLGAAALLILASPIFLLCPILIRLGSRGPVFFRQRRCGRGGKQFWMLKFRTMVVNAENMQAELRVRNDTDGPVFKMVRDPRVTRLGGALRRTSIDELPQLLNVLRGEMSLVGPRPLAAEEMSHCPAWRDRRLSVRPGITGLWQVSGRSRLRFHEWIRYDIDYVKRQSLGLDLRILLQTVGEVIRRSGA